MKYFLFSAWYKYFQSEKQIRIFAPIVLDNYVDISGGGVPAQWIFFISLIRGAVVLKGWFVFWLGIYTGLSMFIVLVIVGSSSILSSQPSLSPLQTQFRRNIGSTNLIYCRAAKIINENIGLIIPCSKYFGIVANNLDSLKTLLGLRRPILSVESLKRQGVIMITCQMFS